MFTEPIGQINTGQVTYFKEGMHVPSITLDLRQAVMHKIHGKDEQGLRDMIEGSIDAQETALPGLGVVFETIWKHIDASEQNELVSVLKQQVDQASLKPLK
jgi:small acid-soluble spore protein I (minor)